MHRDPLFSHKACTGDSPVLVAPGNEASAHHDSHVQCDITLHLQSLDVWLLQGCRQLSEDVPRLTAAALPLLGASHQGRRLWHRGGHGRHCKATGGACVQTNVSVSVWFGTGAPCNVLCSARLRRRDMATRCLSLPSCRDGGSPSQRQTQAAPLPGPAPRPRSRQGPPRPRPRPLPAEAAVARERGGAGPGQAGRSAAGPRPGPGCGLLSSSRASLRPPAVSPSRPRGLSPGARRSERGWGLRGAGLGGGRGGAGGRHAPGEGGRGKAQPAAPGRGGCAPPG